MDPYMYMDNYFLQRHKGDSVQHNDVFSKSSQICQVVIVGTRSPRWQWLKDRRREKPAKREQRKTLNPGVRASGETKMPPSWLAFICIRQISGGGRRWRWRGRWGRGGAGGAGGAGVGREARGGDKTYKKRKPNGFGPLLHTSGMDFLYQVKLSCNRAVTMVCHFKSLLW